MFLIGPVQQLLGLGREEDRLRTLGGEPVEMVITQEGPGIGHAVLHPVV